MCAERPDRKSTVIPVIQAIGTELRESIDADLRQFNRAARRFHSAIVDCCGNDTIRLTVGGWVSLWSAHEESWSNQVNEEGSVSFDLRRQVCDSHDRILVAISDGDSSEAARLSTHHLAAAQQHHFSVDVRTGVDATLLIRSGSTP
jgi:DNA-binding FadR family transcriptional regulator